MMKVSIIVPAYNEEKRIGKTLKKMTSYLDRKKYDYELLVVNDGSKDRTADIVRSFKHKKVKLIDCKKNMGKGGQ